MATHSQHRKVAFLTTFNQACGLATYASYLVRYFADNQVIICAEDVLPSERVGADGKNVFRCWTRGARNYDALLSVIERENVAVLHLNCHYRFFDTASFPSFLKLLSTRGVKTVAHIHNPYTLDAGLQALVQSVDCVVVHTPENRIEVIANGASETSVEVIEHGVECVANFNYESARVKLGIAKAQKVVVCFGFLQAHKGIDEVIHVVHALKLRHPDIHLHIVGGEHKEDPNSVQYSDALKKLAADCAITDRVHFVNGFVSEEVVNQYLIAADAVVMNYRSQYFEASGAVARALGCGAAIITSLAPPFARLGDSVFHITSGYPLPIALEQVLYNPKLNSALRAGAKAWADEYSWFETANKFSDLYRQLTKGAVCLDVDDFSQSEGRRLSIVGSSRSKIHAVSGVKRILMQNRPNALTQRGGDTVVMEHLATGLRARGVEVDIDVQYKKDLRDYDLVHLFNFATPEITENLGKRCHSANVPFVVTTLYEDLPVFYNQMIAQFRAFEAYCSQGQPANRWHEFINGVKSATPSSRWENSWTAHHALALMASGNREKETLLRDYPDAQLVETFRLGCEVGVSQDDGTLFRRETGLSDFVFCVGRLETRKNQLMLLRALEDSDVTVVFATGGFTYQPEYEKLCREYKRAGKTVFLGRISPELLSSAYAAAKVHALASWYELPGIVSMEAARRGTNIVVSDYGTPRDYFGDAAYYSLPDDAEGLYNAVMAGYYAPLRKGLTESVSECTWQNSANDVYAIYEKAMDTRICDSQSSSCKLGNVLEKSCVLRQTSPLQVSVADSAQRVNFSIQTASNSALEASESIAEISNVLASKGASEASDASAETMCADADNLLKNGKTQEALKKFMKVLQLYPGDLRACRGIGVVALQEKRFIDAADAFRKALASYNNDAKSLTGLGASKWGLGKREEGYRIYVKALEHAPFETSALLHLIDASYALNKFEELESALVRYIAGNPNSLDIKFCLAGCLFKQGKYIEARKCVEEILSVNAEHRDSLDLLEAIKNLVGKSEDTKIIVNDPSALSTQKPLFENLAETPVAQFLHSGASKESSDSISAQLVELETLKYQQQYNEIIEKANSLLDREDCKGDSRALVLILKGEACACSGNTQIGEELFVSAQNSNTYRHRALSGRGAIYASRSEWRDAKQLFNESLQLKPDYDVALAGVGMCFEQIGKYQDAWSYYWKAINSNPENLRAIFGIVKLGYVLDRKSDILTATNAYLEIHPANLSILYAHAGCLYAMNRFRDAAEYVSKIKLFNPEHELACELQVKIDEKLASEVTV